MDKSRDYIKDALFGLAVGDALGVPVEFQNREELRKKPLVDMIGFGTHNQPAGTWSDDSSLAFCLAETLASGFDLQTLANAFVAWLGENYWTPRGSVFDIGIATRKAIMRLAKGERPDLAGGFEVSDNGNGSLMRILPLVFYIKDKPIGERFLIVKNVSSLTHAHVRSVMACFYYLEFARLLLLGTDKHRAYESLKLDIEEFFLALDINPLEIVLFDRLLNGDIFTLSEKDISSSGYVLHTLEASIWCLLTTNNYKDAVLKAVNLGEDTDTTGAVTGGLAGLIYGVERIPQNWLDQLVRKEDIRDLADRMTTKLNEEIQ